MIRYMRTYLVRYVIRTLLIGTDGIRSIGNIDEQGSLGGCQDLYESFEIPFILYLVPGRNPWSRDQVKALCTLFCAIVGYHPHS